jgi:hypothetical protein
MMKKTMQRHVQVAACIAIAFSGSASAGSTPSIQFLRYDQDLNVLRDQVLKASGIQYEQKFPTYASPALNRPIREVATGSEIKIPTRKPNHQFQVNSVVGTTGAAGGWVGFDSNVPEGFVWTPSRGTTYIPPLAGHVRTEVFGVSADGNAAFGRSFSGNQSKTFYWSRDGQMVDVSSAVSGGQTQFTPKRMLTDGTIEGLGYKSSYYGPAFNATWSPSQGLVFGSEFDHTLYKKTTSPAGTLSNHYDAMDYTGELKFTNAAGDVKTLLHFGEGQSADAVWLSPDGNLAIANLDLDQGWNLYQPRAGVFHTDMTIPDMYPESFLLSDYLVDELGLDPNDLQGKYLYTVLAVSPDGNLIFGSAGTDGLWDPFADSHFLIDLRGNSNPSVPEPATWITLAAAATLVVVRRRRSV